MIGGDYLFKRRAEKYILKRIESLNQEMLLLTRYDIENEIKLFYIQGAFSKKTADRLKCMLIQKYDDLYEQYLIKLENASDRDYQSMLRRLSNT